MKLTDIFVKEVSLVDSPANGVKLLLVKRLETKTEPTEDSVVKKISDDLTECLKLAKNIK